MKTKAHFSLVGGSGEFIASGDATASIETDSLQVRPEVGEARWYSLRDVKDTSSKDYRLNIDFATGESLTLFSLGYSFEDFVRTLHQTRNELVLHDLLAQEKVRKKGVYADYRWINAGGSEMAKGRCEPRLYDTALVILPERGELSRVPYSTVSSVVVDGYSLLITTERGERCQLGMLGRELEPMRKVLADAVADMDAQVQAMLKDAYPEGDGRLIAQAAKLMKDGRAASRTEVEAACPGLWHGLEMKVAGYDLEEEYKLLSGLSHPERVRIGIKRSLVPGEEEQGKLGEYVFFFAPIFSADPAKGGNAVAFEAASGEGEGRATYFFRIMERSDYAGKGAEELGAAAERAMDGLLVGLAAINFRREPIYLADAKLYTPEFNQYRYALARIPELKMLRDSFIGRVIHTDPLQWATDISDLLTFNVTTKDPKARWVKAEDAGAQN